MKREILGACLLLGECILDVNDISFYYKYLVRVKTSAVGLILHDMEFVFKKKTFEIPT